MEIMQLAVIIGLFILQLAEAQRQQFRERPSNFTVVQGGDAILRCVIDNRRGAVHWAKDGGILGKLMTDFLVFDMDFMGLAEVFMGVQYSKPT